MSNASNVYADELYGKNYFSQYSNRENQFYSWLLIGIITYGKPGKVIDLGAGVGLFVELAYRWGLDITGLEGSSYAVEEATNRVSDLKMMVHDLSSPLPFKDASVANIVLNQVIEHVEMQTFGNILQESHRVLEKEGCLFIYSPSKRNKKEKIEDPTHINMMLPSELVAHLEKANFQVMHQFNSGFWFYPDGNHIINILAKVLLRLLPNDWFSATANAIAKKI
jgi:SAM-dependent methyltransferase